MAVIELGEPAPVTDEPTAPHRWRPRPWLITAVALLCVVALTGSARPHGGRPGRILWSAPIAAEDQITVAGDAVLQQRTGWTSELTVYDLATGALRWRTGDAPLTRVLPSPADAVVLVVDDQGVATPNRDGGTVTARRSADGATVWQQPGTVLTADAGLALIADHDTRGWVIRLRQVRVADGAALWRRSIAPARDVLVEPTRDGHFGRVLTVTNGRIDLYRWADGVPSASGRVTLAPDSLLSAVHGRLRADRYATAGITSTWYDLTDFRQLGTIDAGTVPAVECGPLVCRAGPASVTATEAGTGREVWRRTDVAGFALVTADRLLLIATDGSTRTLVDPATGRALATHVPGEAVANDTVRDSVLLLHDTRSPAGRSAAVRLDLTTGAWRTLGLLPSIRDPRRCVGTAAGLLLCQDNNRMLVATVPV
ncbi:outer membrane protein assembly factor BamB family protein [Actinoplanes palleronii]|uniref:Pyrrolo-quinoline quinone repeat domain-containing protein n=1 Tax=Actinoplanes palleronii TaxID=113570 RepID=A0ABQ4B4C9_9ACTN|nr:PQQ-binding-like beta-propeller repeat protein [Actinoplanes palleronii]GIE65476.1 hypothetical protein Apa02nite_015840 [Actinoplanes palleronii]